jgi:hypothetical protein
VNDRRNLFFFCTHGKQTEDFREVARRIGERAPDILPHVFTTRAAVRPFLVSAALMHRPTVSIEMDNRRGRPRILRGVRLVHGGAGGGKVAEFRHLDAHGLPIPKWTEIQPDTTLDPQEWGPYVVVKPSRGGRGAYVWVQKTGRVRFKAPADFPDGHPGREGPMIAQRFIYTGRWPVAYRILTYFGRPVGGLRYDGRQDIPALESESGFNVSGGRSIVAAAKGCRISFANEQAVLDLASRIHLALPTVPSIGADIVREERTGSLYLMEINAGGNSWQFTSDSGLEIQAEFGLDFYSQFNALDVIADRSIEIAREYAR